MRTIAVTLGICLVPSLANSQILSREAKALIGKRANLHEVNCYNAVMIAKDGRTEMTYTRPGHYKK